MMHSRRSSRKKPGGWLSPNDPAFTGGGPCAAIGGGHGSMPGPSPMCNGRSGHGVLEL